MNKKKALNLLGLAMRAGKLISGEELVIKSIRNQRADLVLVAQDASENTKKKIKDKSKYYEIPCTDFFTSEELSQSIGKPRMVIGILDKGFAKKIEELILG